MQTINNHITNSERFMLIFIEKFFDKLRCESLSKYLFEQHKAKKLAYEGNNQHYKNSYGASLPDFEKLLQDMTPMVKKLVGREDLIIRNSFSRIYFNDSILKKHVDRKGLDVTMTVSIHNDTGVDWPLHVQTDDGVKSVVTNVGDAAIILGTKMPHWREALSCQNGQMVMQCFFHWGLPA